MDIIDEGRITDGNMEWRVTSEPSVEPVTVTELKTFARIDGNDEDTLIGEFIKSARIQVENYLGYKLITQTVTVSMDYWPSERLVLPAPPLISVTEVRTLDEDGTETVYSSSNYYIRVLKPEAEIIIKRGSTPPYVTNRSYGGIEIEIQVGYGATSSSVPQIIVDAVKLSAASFYENRVISSKLPPEARLLLQGIRRNNI